MFGVVGYCWGGGISFGYATQQPDLGAAVVYYGISPSADALRRVQAPVLGLYGGNDARVTSTVPPAQGEMKTLGKRYDVEIYPGAGHAFLRQATGANLSAARKAWPRTIAFLKETLEKKDVSAAPAPVQIAEVIPAFAIRCHD
jgi:carboxymethylenebutenolidase